MVKRNKDSLNALLIGDKIGSLAEQLDVGDVDVDKLLVIMVAPSGVRLAKSEGISKAEALGALHIAIELETYEA